MASPVLTRFLNFSFEIPKSGDAPAFPIPVFVCSAETEIDLRPSASPVFLKSETVLTARKASLISGGRKKKPARLQPSNHFDGRSREEA